MEAVAGIILAGGKGKRLGVTNKALYSLDGKALLDHVTASLNLVFNRLVLLLIRLTCTLIFRERWSKISIWPWPTQRY